MRNCDRAQVMECVRQKLIDSGDSDPHWKKLAQSPAALELIFLPSYMRDNATAETSEELGSL